MTVGVLTRIDRDESGNASDPQVRVFSSKAAAKDAMIADFTKTKKEKFPDPDFIFDDECEEETAYIAGTEDDGVNWYVSEARVEG